MTSKAKFREQFTPEERRAYMQAKTDRLAEQLKDGVESFKNSDKFKELLAVAAKFPSYSFRNWVMIHQQNPKATRVMSKKNWFEKFGRTIKREEYGKPINIWVPFFGKDEAGEDGLKGFGIGPVYDVTQTDGPDLPNWDWRIDGDEGESIYNALLAYASKKHIEIKEVPVSGNEGGWYDYENFTINVVPASRAMMARTLIHELAHSQDVNLNKQSRGEEETIADSVAYMVCSAFDIPTGTANFEYIANWTQSDAGVKTIDKVMKVVKGIGGELIEFITDYVEEHEAAELVAA